MPGCTAPRQGTSWPVTRVPPRLGRAELIRTIDEGSPSLTGNAEQGRADVVGMWVTADGHIRQELQADGRYDEARGTRRSAFTGRYTVTGSHIV